MEGGKGGSDDRTRRGGRSERGERSKGLAMLGKARRQGPRSFHIPDGLLVSPKTGRWERCRRVEGASRNEEQGYTGDTDDNGDTDDTGDNGDTDDTNDTDDTDDTDDTRAPMTHLRSAIVYRRRRISDDDGPQTLSPARYLLNPKRPDPKP